MTAQATPAKATFDQEVLDQVAIFNEIITYLKSHVITSISSETNQYFETVDCKYEYVDKKLTITVKPSSAIYPKIQSLKVDVLNKFDVHVDCKDVCEKVSKLEEMFGKIDVHAISQYGGYGELITGPIDQLFVTVHRTNLIKQKGPLIAVIHLNDILNSQIESIPRIYLNRLTTIDTNTLSHQCMIHELGISNSTKRLSIKCP